MWENNTVICAWFPPEALGTSCMLALTVTTCDVYLPQWSHLQALETNTCFQTSITPLKLPVWQWDQSSANHRLQRGNTEQKKGKMCVEHTAGWGVEVEVRPSAPQNTHVLFGSCGKGGLNMAGPSRDFSHKKSKQARLFQEYFVFEV